MRLLAPAFAAMRSTRAPASPWAENSCFAASRMRRRMPSGSRCHFRTRFGLDFALDFACALANRFARVMVREWMYHAPDRLRIEQDAESRTIVPSPLVGEGGA